MTPTSLLRIGPYALRADADADVIRALEASGNKIGLIRACVRLVMNAPTVSVAMRGAHVLTDEEWKLIERAREG